MKTLVLSAAFALALSIGGAAAQEPVGLSCAVTVDARGVPFDGTKTIETYKLFPDTKTATWTSDAAGSVDNMQLEITDTQYKIGVYMQTTEKQYGYQEHRYPAAINRLTGDYLQSTYIYDKNDKKVLWQVIERGTCRAVSATPVL
jgi:hypothetical protein